MRRSCLPVLIALALRLFAYPQNRTVAITVDDLPYVLGTDQELTPADGALAIKVNRRLLAAFRQHHVPVTGFVIARHAEELGPAGRSILTQWTTDGLDLGNHTYSHPDVNRLTVSQVEDEIVRAEAIIAPLMNEAGEKLRFFRFPMNHTGESKAKHNAIADFLRQRGYRLAVCTIDNSDYLFNRAYVSARKNRDRKMARRLRAEYLSYTNSEIDYYAGLNKQVLGYEPPQVMLLHDNRLNADVIDGVLHLFEKKNYSFVSLGAAESDAAYQIPDSFITQYGMMWGYRWARERGVKVNGRLEPEPPQWVLDYDRVKR